MGAIHECTNDSCLPPLTFDWSSDVEEEPEFTAPIQGYSFGTHDHYAGGKPADINGDGLMDWVHLYYDENDDEYFFHEEISHGTGFSGGRIQKAYSSNRKSWHIIDYNNDGKQDMIFASSAHWFVRLSDGSLRDQGGAFKISGQNSVDIPATNATRAQFVDMNGDGLTDMLTWDGNGQQGQVRYLQRNGLYPTLSSIPYRFGNANPVTFAASGDFRFRKESPFGMDFNGDGRGDTVVRKQVSGGDQWQPMVLTGTSQFIPYGSPSVAYDDDDLRVIDINGDGLADLFYREDQAWYYAINNGAGFNARVQLNGVTYWDRLQFADFNGDGKMDLLYPQGPDNSATKSLVSYWYASGFGDFVLVDLNMQLSAATQYLLAEQNGDGRPDFMRVGKPGYRIAHQQNAFVPLHKITGFSNGLGNVTTIDYRSMTDLRVTDDLVYRSANNANDAHWDIKRTIDEGLTFVSLFKEKDYPVFDLFIPRYLVRQVNSTAPSVTGDSKTINHNATSSVQYEYYGGKLQGAGRGFLGFERVTTIDLQTQIETTSTYRQDYPYIGAPLTTEVKVPNSSGQLSTISYAINGYQQRNNLNGTQQHMPYQPYLHNSVEKTYNTTSSSTEWAINGLQSRVVTTNTQDDYGNLTQIQEKTIAGSGTYKTTTVNTYGTSIYELEMGRLARVEVTKERSGQSPNTRTSAFEYYTSGALKGLLKKEIVEPDTVAFKITKAYEYDSLW